MLNLLGSVGFHRKVFSAGHPAFVDFHQHGAGQSGWPGKDFVKLKKLEKLRLDNTQVSDLSPLAELKNLRSFYLFDTQVSDEQLQELRQALPNCTVYHSVREEK